VTPRPDSQPGPPARWPTALLGAFLGLALLKFGNPVILDRQVSAPTTVAELWFQPWPLRWAYPAFFGVLLVVEIAILRSSHRIRGARLSPWLLLPIGWLAWQFVAAGASVDATLTRLTLPHFMALLGAYYCGRHVAGRSPNLPALLSGLGVAAVFCWLRAVNQHVVEFPQDHALLVEGQRVGWTNFPSAAVEEMRGNGLIVLTNGVEIVQPQLLEKLKRGRAYGTLVYPNALAGSVLLLLPGLLVATHQLSERLRPAIGRPLVALVAFLGVASLYWSGSKSGWLIALVVGAASLFQLPRLKRARIPAAAILILVGLAVFGFRFSNYFSRGATSISARLDYWRAAVQITAERPVFGTGPGTFQRPYEVRKHPEAEMARLTHNDYLEQFSDSGVPGGLLYLAWIGSALVTIRRQNQGPALQTGVILGVVGWFGQGIAEFSLYVPGLAWTAFVLLGYLTVPPSENPSTVRGDPRQLTGIP
jgi:hypothetical protein